MPAHVLPESERLTVSARAILFGSGPRFARDAFGPVLAFYVVYKISGLALAIAAATGVAFAAWWYERRHERSGLLAWLTLAIIVVQAVIGLVAGDARAYLAPALLANLVWGLAFIGSVVVRRPLAGVFAGEMYPFPPEVRASRTFVRVFSTVSLAWGALVVVRSGMRLFALGDIVARLVRRREPRDRLPAHDRDARVVDLVRDARVPAQRGMGLGAPLSGAAGASGSVERDRPRRASSRGDLGEKSPNDLLGTSCSHSSTVLPRFSTVTVENVAREK